MLFFFTFIILVSLSLPTLSQLPSSTVAQTPCLNPPTTTTWESVWFFTNPLSPYYVSMGSQHLFRSYAEIFLGRPAVDELELNGMNLTIAFEATYTVLTFGYGRTMIQQCLPKTILSLFGGLFGIVDLSKDPLGLTSLTQGDCHPILNPLDPSLNTSSVASSYDRIVWSNEAAGAVLITRCVNRKIADWKVLSTTPQLPNNIRQEILTTVAQLGYDL